MPVPKVYAVPGEQYYFMPKPGTWQPRPIEQRRPVKLSYWYSPSNLAKWYQRIRTRAPDQELPQWMDQDGVELAYEYQSYRNKGRPWYAWGAIHPDDPLNDYLLSIPEPPIEEISSGEWLDLEFQQQTYEQLQKDRAAAEQQEALEQAMQQGYYGQPIPGIFPENIEYPNPAEFTDEEWSQLPGWQRIFYSMSANPALSGIFSMSPFMIPGVIAGARTGSWAGVVGSVVGIGTAGAALGTVADPGTYEWLVEHGADPDKAAATQRAAQKILWALNVGAEATEKTYGTLAQLAESDEDIQYLLDNLPEAWRAAYSTYEAYSPQLGELKNLLAGPPNYLLKASYRMIENFYNQIGVELPIKEEHIDKILSFMPWQRVFEAPLDEKTKKMERDALTYLQPANIIAAAEWLIDMVKYGESDARFAGPGEAHIIGLPEPVKLDAVGTAALDIARQRAIRGEPPEKILADMQATFGFTGQFTDLLIQAVADPYNFMPMVERGLVGYYAKRTGNEVLDLAQSVARGEGIIGTQRIYGELLRTGQGPAPAQMTRWQRWVAGVTPEGTIRELTPRGRATRAVLTFAEQPFNPLAWLQSLRELTPSSRGRAILGLAHENTGLLLEQALSDPNRMFELIEAWSDLSPAEAAQVSKLLGNPEAITVRQALADYGPALNEKRTAYEAGEEPRRLLLNISEAINETPTKTLAMMNEGKAEDVYTRLREALAAEGSDAARVVLEDAAFTSEALADAIDYLNNHPWHPDHVQADLHNSILEHTAEWAQRVYGIRPDNRWLRFTSGLKSIQSLMLLGFNPAYAINNSVSNAVFRASMGVWGMPSPETIRQFFDDFGIEPYRTRAGIGQADIPMAQDLAKGGGKVAQAFAEGGREAAEMVGMQRAENVLRRAMRAKDGLQAFQDYAGKLSSYGPFTRLAQAAERRGSAAAMYIGVKGAISRLWNRQGLIPKLPPGLEAALREIDPRLPPAVYSALESSIKPDTISEIAKGVMRHQIDQYLPDVARDMNVSLADLRQMLTESGAWDILNNSLMEGDTVPAAFNKVDDAIQDYLDTRLRSDLITRAVQAETEVKAEGFAKALTIFTDIQWKLEELWTRHFAEWERTFALADHPSQTYQSRRNIIEAQVRRSDREWRRHKYWEQTTWSGVLKGMGFTDPNSTAKLSPEARSFANLLITLHESWDGFYNQKSKLIKDYYNTKFETKQARKDGWARVQEQLADLYEQHVKQDYNTTLAMGTDFVELFIRRFGRDKAAGAAEWWNAVLDLTTYRQALMRDFRAWERGVPISELTMPEVIEVVDGFRGANRHEAWTEFLKKAYLPAIGQHINAGFQGAYKMYQDVTGGRFGEEMPEVDSVADFEAKVAELKEAEEPIIPPEEEPEVVREPLEAKQTIEDALKIAQEFDEKVTNEVHLRNIIRAYGGEEYRDIDSAVQITPEELRRIMQERARFKEEQGIQAAKEAEEEAPEIERLRPPRAVVVEGEGRIEGGKLYTKTDREIPLPPKIRTDTERKAQIDVKKVDKWLLDQAIDEATSRGDTWNAENFARLDPTKLHTADRDLLNDYLFGMDDIFARYKPEAEGPPPDVSEEITDAVDTYKEVQEAEEKIKEWDESVAEEAAREEPEPERLAEPVASVFEEYVRISDEYFVNTKEGFYRVDAKKVTVPGYEQFDFFIHRSLRYEEDLVPRPTGPRWVITEGMTGQFITEHTRQAGAVQFAKQRMDEVIRRGGSFEDVIRNHIDNIGLSPRYELNEDLPPQPSAKWFPFRTREERKAALVEAFKYTDAAADVELDILEEAAKVWAVRNRRSEEAFWNNIYAVLRGGDIGRGTLLQERPYYDTRDRLRWQRAKEIYLGPETWEDRGYPIGKDIRTGYRSWVTTGERWEIRAYAAAYMLYDMSKPSMPVTFKSFEEAARYAYEHTPKEGRVYPSLFQDALDPRAAYTPVPASPLRIIQAMDAALPDSWLHETGHYFFDYVINEADRQTVAEWAETQTGDYDFETGLAVFDYVKTTEAFADGYVRYRLEGRAPTAKLKRIWIQFQDFLRGVIGKLRERFNLKSDWIPGQELTPEMHEVYERIFRLDEWELTQDEFAGLDPEDPLLAYVLREWHQDLYDEKSLRKLHKQIIAHAIDPDKGNRNVPYRVLKDYPNLLDKVADRYTWGDAVEIDKAVEVGDKPQEIKPGVEYPIWNMGDRVRWAGSDRVWEIWGQMDPERGTIKIVDPEHRSVKMTVNMSELSRMGEASLAGLINDLVETGMGFKSSAEFEEYVKDYGFDLMKEADLTLAYDALEGAFNLQIRKVREMLRNESLPQRIVYLEMKEKQLVKARRTLKKLELQQFSTPWTISEAASVIADVRPDDIIIEPTAGNANLVDMFFGREDLEVLVNEIDPGRISVLQEMGYDPTTIDLLSKEWVLDANGKILPPLADVMIANFPWGAYSTGKYGTATHHPVKLNDWSQRFTYLALQRLADGGRLVNVVPTNWFFSRQRGTGEVIYKKSAFVKWIEENYWLRAVIESPPGAYDQRATGVSSLIVVIDKRAKPYSGTVEGLQRPLYAYAEAGKGETPNRGQPEDFNSYAELINQVYTEYRRSDRDVTDARAAVGRVEREPIRPVTGPDATGLTDPAATRGEPTADAENIGNLVRGERPAEIPPGGTARPGGRPDTGGIEPTSEPSASVRPRQDRDAIQPEREGGGPGPRLLAGETPATRPPTEYVYPKYSPEFQERLDATRDAVSNSGSFTVYVPRSPLRTSDLAHTHPTAVVETKALSGIPYPPLEEAYRPSQAVFDALNRRAISVEGNLDPTWAAIQQNDKHNRGIMIADDVGIGKSRTGAAFVLDRIEKGKKRILVITDGHQNVENLMNVEFPGVYNGKIDQYGGFEEVNPTDFPARMVRIIGADFPAVKRGEEPLPVFDEPTVYFISDHEVRDFWEPIRDADFEVVVVDEVHNFKNLGTQTAAAWYGLHKKWLVNDVDFMYLSATPGIDVAELQYLYGLKAWTLDGFTDWIKIITGQESPEAIKKQQDARKTIDSYLETIQAAKEKLSYTKTTKVKGSSWQKKPVTVYEMGPLEIYYDNWSYFKEWIIEHPEKEMVWGIGDKSETEALLLADILIEFDFPTHAEAERLYTKNYPKPTREDLGSLGITDVSDILNVVDQKGKWGAKKLSAYEMTLPPAHTEQIMRELKQSGSYMSRDISREGVVFEAKEIQLTTQQLAEHNERVDLYRNIYEAWLKFGKENEGPKKYAAMFGVNGDIQADAKRSMFNLRLPHIIEEAKQAIARGQKVVISTISVSAGSKKILENAINKINIHKVDKLGQGEYTDPVDIPEALLVRAELYEDLQRLPEIPSPIDVLNDAFRDRIKFITGDVSPRERAENSKLFQNDLIDVIVISGAGKTGINLHDITGKQVHLIVGDYEWSASTFKQEMGRVDRTGQRSSPNITLLHTGSAGEMKFVSTIANRMKGLGATSKGGAESTGVDALSTDFEFGSLLDFQAMTDAWDSLSGVEKNLFMDKAFQSQTTPDMPSERLAPNAGNFKKFLLGLQQMRIKDANRIWDKYILQREMLMGSEAAVELEQRMASKSQGEIMRTTQLDQNLYLAEVRTVEDKKYGVVYGTLTPYMNRIKQLTQSPNYWERETGRAWMKWVQFYDDAKNVYVSGLVIRPTYIKRLADGFGTKAGGGWRPETAMVDLQAGDRIPIHGAGGSEWELYVGRAGSREGKIVVDNARIRDKDALMNNGAQYNAIGTFFFVPEGNLQQFLKRFPIREVVPDVDRPTTLYQTSPETGKPEATEGAKRYSQSRVPDDYSVMRLPRAIEVDGMNIVGMVFRDGELVAWLPERVAVGREFTTAKGKARLLGVDGENNWVFANEKGDIDIYPRDSEDAPLPVGPLAPGTLESVGASPHYDYEVLEDGYTGWVRPAMDALQKRMTTADPDMYFTGDMAPSLNQLPTEMRNQFANYLSDATQELSKAKLAAVRIGEAKRDLSLMNYSRRYGFDNWLTSVIPYQFWFTRAMSSWALRIMDRPAFLAQYLRLKQFMDKQNRDEGMPSRLKGKMRFPAPWLPDWMGGGLWVDPVGKLFPMWELFHRPLEMLNMTNDRVTRAADYIIGTWVEQEEITEEEGTIASSTREGPIWERAVAQAKSEEGVDMLDYMSLITSPALYLTIPYLLAKGQPEKISPTPYSRTIRSIAAATGLEGLNYLDFEGMIRQKAGLSQFGEWGEYYVDRQLSNMAAEGYDPKLIEMAMIDQTGPLYEEAVRRVELELSLRTPGASTILAARNIPEVGLREGLPDLLGSMLFGWLPAGLLPEGELIQRGLKDEYDAAWKEYHAGNKEAIDEFFDKYPEYKARLALWDDKPERLRQNLISSVWDKYLALPQMNRNEAADQLGPQFQTNFLNKDTRDYDSLNVETLAFWANMLDAQLPETAPTVPEMDLEFTDPKIAKQYDDYQAQKRELFPEINTVQEYYFNAPPEMQDAILEMHPELEQYWRWREKYMAENPDMIPHLVSEESELYYAPPEIQQAVYQYRAVREQQFPGIFDIQEKYYSLPKSARKQFLKDNPELPAYWEWQRTIYAQFPELIPYIRSEETIARDVLGSDYEEKYPIVPNLDPQDMTPALMMGLMTYYADGRMGEGTRKELRRLWELDGRPGTFEQWVDGLRYLVGQ